MKMVEREPACTPIDCSTTVRFGLRMVGFDLTLGLALIGVTEAAGGL
jgi:hypothetical protein